LRFSLIGGATLIGVIPLVSNFDCVCNKTILHDRRYDSLPNVKLNNRSRQERLVDRRSIERPTRLGLSRIVAGSKNGFDAGNSFMAC
jgi:hypothetical protein